MRKAIIVALVAVLGLLFLLGYGLANRGSAATSEPAALRSGRPASDFSIKLFSGGTFTLADQRGKAVVVNFWASWCPPCKEEAPLLERTWQSYKDQGVVLVGVNVWDKEQDALAFIQRYGLTFPNGPDPSGQIAVEYGLTGLPETWFVNKEGKLVRRWIGALSSRQISTFIEEAQR